MKKTILVASVGAAVAAIGFGVMTLKDPRPATAVASVVSNASAPPVIAAAPPAVIVKPIDVVPGMPAVIDPQNLYSEVTVGKMSAQTSGALERVYVPNRGENTVSVIDPATLKVINKFKVGINPQHVVPSWDLKTLWVANNAEGRTDGSLTPIDPTTGKPGKFIPVDDPYNMYFSPDGKFAIVVAEAFKRLDFRDPVSMKMVYSIATPDCPGINHADFSIDGKIAYFTCEFGGGFTKIDLVNRKVLTTIKLSRYFNRPDALAAIDAAKGKPVRTTETGLKQIADPTNAGAEICATPGMPQDARISPDGKTLYVADMMSDGVHVVDAESFKQIDFLDTGVGAHGLYPSRDGKTLYVANRGGNRIRGTPLGKGSVSVIDFATRKVIKQWPIPGGGSPDMGNISADGNYLWLSGRYDNTVYRIDTRSGGVDKIAVGREPHGLTVWPQPGRYSLGHTGNMR